MGKTLTQVLLWVLMAMPAWGQDSPHQQANACRLEFRDACDNVCVVCHMEGGSLADLSLCLDCHPGKGGTEDHPVAIDYDSLKTKLVALPQGPKLFCTPSGANCKVQCATCHDPHSNAVDLLRLSNQRSTLCRSCHLK